MEFRVHWGDGTMQRLTADGVMPVIRQAVALYPTPPDAAPNTHYIARIEEQVIDGSGREKWISRSEGR